MTSRPHLEIFTLDTPQPNGFPLFPKLPPELRLKIWKHSLQHHRIIKLHLLLPLSFDRILAQNGQTKPASHQHQSYCPVVHGYQTLSKLLRVNKEARQAALSFYRVHFPCWLTKGASRSETLVPGTIYFNPEYDFLHVTQLNMDILDLYYDLKFKYDPLHVGLLNLALCNSLLSTGPGSFALLEPSKVNPTVMETFKDIMSQLQEVFFVSVQNIARQILGRDSGSLVLWETFFNRSFPITAMALNFERLHQDPRPADDDFKGIAIVGNPRDMYTSWLNVMDTLGIDPPKIQYRILLTFSPHDRVYNQEDGERWLKREDDIWTGTYEFTGPFSTIDWKSTPGAQLPKFQDEDLDKAVRPAFGFWLFPVDAFDDGSERGAHSNQVSSWDVSKYWPELGLLRLPPSSGVE